MELSDWGEFKVFLFVEKKQSQSSSNVQAQKSRYKKMTEFFSVRPFNKKTFNAFINALQEQKFSSSYINNFIKMGKLIAEYHSIDELKEYTYFKEKHQIFVDTLTPTDISNLAEVFIPYARNADEINYRMKTLIYFLGRTGCRIGEALNLVWDDVFNEYVIFRDTKNGEDRMVPIKESLYQLIYGIPRLSQKVFSIGTPQEVNLDLKRRARATGITKVVYCHLFRHSYISEMTKQKIPVSYIARIVGHQSLETTNRYTHAVLDDLQYMMSYHPLEKQEQTFEDVKIKVKEFLDKLVNKDRVKYQLDEGSKELSIKLVSY